MAGEVLVALVVFAFITEVVTDIIKAAIPSLKKYSRLIAMLVGILLCVTTDMGIISGFGIKINYPLIDYVISGITISRGSNVIHDLLSKINGNKKTA